MFLFNNMKGESKLCQFAPLSNTNHVKGNRSREGVMKLENFASDHLFSDFLIFEIFTQTYKFFFFEMVNIECVFTKQNVKKRSATIIKKVGVHGTLVLNKCSHAQDNLKY